MSKIDAQSSEKGLKSILLKNRKGTEEASKTIHNSKEQSSRLKFSQGDGSKNSGITSSRTNYPNAVPNTLLATKVSKTQKEDNTSINKLNEKTNANENQSSHSGVFVPKNLNEYVHLINDPKDHLTGEEIQWSLGLRSYPLYNPKEKKKEKNFLPPSFYENDLEKYKEKNLKRTQSAVNFRRSNFSALKHLTEAKGRETITNGMFNFTTTLREWKQYPHSFYNKNEWVGYTSVSNRPITSHIEQISKTTKYAVRPYNIFRDKSDIGNGPFMRRKYVVDEKNVMNWFGAHNAYPAFTDKFDEKNYNNLMYYYKSSGQNLSISLFQMGLRGSYNKRIGLEANKRVMKKTKSMPDIENV